MQVFTSSAHGLHAPLWYVADGTVRPCPDDPQRVAHILGTLKDAGHTIQTVGQTVGSEKPGFSNPQLENLLMQVHAPDYLQYLATIHRLWTAEFGKEVDVIPDTFPRRDRPRPAKPAAQAGYYCFDMAAPITAGTYEAALVAAACAAGAAEAVLKGDRAAYALCRPPGHHAGADYYGGFCYLNNAAVAAQRLVVAGRKRVAILDIDYHHGNGTQDIFYGRSDVLFVSIHAEPDTQYPYFWGHADETGSGAGAGFTRNFPLPRGTEERTWLATLGAALQIVREFRPEALVISLGVDTFEQDTVGDFKLSLGGFRHAGREIGTLKLPTVIVQEGGYNLEAVGPCVSHFLSAFDA